MFQIVAKLVENQMCDKLRRQKNRLPMKVQTPSFRTRCPPKAEVHYRYLSHRDTDPSLELRQPFAQPHFRPPGIPLDEALPAAGHTVTSKLKPTLTQPQLR